MLGPDKDNSTDGNIIDGIEHLLKLKYPENTTDYIELHNTNLITAPFNEHKQYDLLVLSGTPWLWDGFQHTNKYKNFINARNAHPEAKVIMMGIGSCLNNKDIDSDILRRPSDTPYLQELTKGATVIVRDTLAYDILKHSDVQSTLLPCPSYWCGIENVERKQGAAAIWYDPRFGISGGDWTDSQKYKEYCVEFLMFVYKHNADVWCANKDDVNGANELGYYPKVLKNRYDCWSAVKGKKHVLSGRVHCAVPAFIGGAETTLLSVDSRSKVLDFQKDFQYKKNEYIKQYMELL